MSVYIATEDDGSQWVKLEDYESLRKIAAESKVIIEQFQKLLGTYTTTDAFVKLAELQTRSAQQRNEAVKPIQEASLQEPEFAIIGEVQIQYCSIKNLRQGIPDVYTKWFSHKDAIEFLKEQLPS